MKSIVLTGLLLVVASSLSSGYVAVLSDGPPGREAERFGGRGRGFGRGEMGTLPNFLF